ncbi:MAG: SpoIIE family protein phosphatase, partial [Hyphomicrobiales bacterium]
GDPAELLAQAAALANERVRTIAARDYPLIGSASTLVAAIVTDGRAWLLSIGDSRGYLAANGELRQVTEDDSWVAEQVRAGLLGADEARVHPRRNVITRAIGTEETLDRRPVELELPPASTLLLCSDGLCGVVDDGTIARLLAAGTAAEAAQALVDEANSRGGPDNIAIALYRAPGA